MTPRHPAPPPQPAQISQEQMILVQAKSNVATMRPRVEMLLRCVEEMEDAAAACTVLVGQSNTLEAVLGLVESISKVQIIQLHAALKEGQDNLSESLEVIDRIQSKIKVFRPAGFSA